MKFDVIAHYGAKAKKHVLRTAGVLIKKSLDVTHEGNVEWEGKNFSHNLSWYNFPLYAIANAQSSTLTLYGIPVFNKSFSQVHSRPKSATAISPL